MERGNDVFRQGKIIIFFAGLGGPSNDDLYTFTLDSFDHVFWNPHYTIGSGAYYQDVRFFIKDLENIAEGKQVAFRSSPVIVNFILVDDHIVMIFFAVYVYLAEIVAVYHWITLSGAFS